MYGVNMYVMCMYMYVYVHARLHINGNLLIEYEPCLPYGDQSWCASCETELAMHNQVSQSTAVFIFVRVRNNRTYVQVYIQCVLPYALLYVVY